ncbi:DUF5684 domain-containing protein [Leifsonia sp. NPDC058230]|uniref:DUF5684 domain-containing protein n=1 Tax=Leifsonia sp. NPDC058230 TaxID=3346391 RepID=UPI0036DAD8A2
MLTSFPLDDLITTQATAYDPVPSLFGGIIGYVLVVLALWPVFTKAGKPGWGALIPIYNTYLLVKIAGYHGALVILYFIPLVNIVVAIIVALGVGRAFGRSAVFSILLLWLFAIIGYFIVGYGRSQYVGPGGRRDTYPGGAPAVA